MSVRGSILTLGERAKAAAHKAAQRVLLRATEAVVEQERGRWPRDSGESASGLDVELTQRGVRVVGRARYTTAIVSRGRRPWRDLVTRLDIAVRAEIPRAAAREIVDALRRR